MHVGVRYPCDYCDYTALRYDNLEAHIKTKHKELEHDFSNDDRNPNRFGIQEVVENGSSFRDEPEALNFPSGHTANEEDGDEGENNTVQEPKVRLDNSTQADITEDEITNVDEQAGVLISTSPLSSFFLHLPPSLFHSPQLYVWRIMETV